ncbi:MAG: glutamate synthase subunit beta [Myxococcales bacterium]|nr:glutamate synthase subunit beta [Myxococcales bacterium]MCB9735530.1 glutamate synthase subunit beta [Deltaproteobacteria bacterium]
MGKPTGFIEWGRQTPRKRDKAIRVRDWGEFIPPFEPGVLAEQAGRCMDCGVPFCMQGCPLGNQIPDWNDLVHRDRWRAAWVALDSTNNFPEFTGRLCPAPCEGACVLNINQDAVTIELIEKEIAERAFAEGWVTPEPPRTRSGKTVAVVGSGPAGLAAAAQLNRAGHTVTVYDKADRPGGLLRYGIPDFKIEKRVVDRRLEVMRAEGVRFEMGVDVGGEGLSFAELKVRHDALVIAIGAERPRDLDVPGRDLDGVHLAMDYLTQQNRVNAGDRVVGKPIFAGGKRVVILGGGDTGSDCLGTAHRQGAESVTQLELLPAPPEKRAGDNPWPQWPMIFRTSSSHEEGGERLYSLMTKRLTGKDGKLTALHAVRVRLERDEHGRSSVVEEPGSELTIPCDLLLLAMGFTGPVAERAHEQLGVALGPRGIAVDKGFGTSVDGVYAAGDAMRGASLIVWAISDGREAARAVDAYLRGAKSQLPTRGANQPFGGR